MNRDILFRAKLKDDYFNEGWQYGLVYCTWFSGSIFKYWLTPIKKENLTAFDTVCVDPETICEYTGLTDKNGTKIFEGDIIKCEWGFLSNGSYHHYEDFIVEFKDSAYYIVPIKKHKNIWTVYLNPESEYEVVGNIYDTNI